MIKQYDQRSEKDMEDFALQMMVYVRIFGGAFLAEIMGETVIV